MVLANDLYVYINLLTYHRMKLIAPVVEHILVWLIQDRYYVHSQGCTLPIPLKLKTYNILRQVFEINFSNVNTSEPAMSSHPCDTGKVVF